MDYFPTETRANFQLKAAENGKHPLLSSASPPAVAAEEGEKKWTKADEEEEEEDEEDETERKRKRRRREEGRGRGEGEKKEEEEA